MKYKVTLNGKTYEVEVEQGKAVLLDEYEALAPAPAAAAASATAPPTEMQYVLLALEGEETLAGFARVISDCATTFYLCDVVVDPDCRGQGLGKALLGHIFSQPEYKGLRGFLITRDAHSFYRPFGFDNIGEQGMMRRPGQ